jgi:hypothetical protein
MFTAPAVALSKAIGRDQAAAIMYRALPLREGLVEEIAAEFRRQRRRIEGSEPVIRIREIYVESTAMRDAMLKALA